MKRRMRGITVYGDFNCPFSALASARVTVLEHQARWAIDWRAVQRRPAIPADGSVLPATTIAGEMAELDRLMTVEEHHELIVPPRQYNTRMACEAYAGTEPERRATVRRQLFAAVWENGDDLGDGAVIHRIVDSTPDRRLAAQWQAAWGIKDRPVVPLMVLADGVTSRGPNVLIRLSRMIDDHRHEPCEADLGGEAPCLAHLVGEPTDTAPSPDR